jgi:hypothetical protein
MGAVGPDDVLLGIARGQRGRWWWSRPWRCREVSERRRKDWSFERAPNAPWRVIGRWEWKGPGKNGAGAESGARG